MKPTLLILAAGVGSRYGGLKQADSFGPHGESIIDYSVYDAAQAGFGKVVFVIRESIREAFIEKFNPERYQKRMEVAFVFQETDSTVAGLSALPAREKPWGTGHAMLMAANEIKEPFLVINADDYYGAESFRQMAGFLTSEVRPDNFAMVGYRLKNTLSESGYVSRGVCQVDQEGNLETVVERLKIQKEEGNIFYYENEERFLLHEDTVVSMNYWGFHPDIFEETRKGFIEFVQQNHGNPKAEYFIPLIVNNMVNGGKASLKVMTTNDKWYGVTYQEDKPVVEKAFLGLYESGTYPEHLF